MMKIIELLNKIANGEEVPKKIKIKGEIWIYDEIDYRASDDRGYLFEVHTRTNCQDLNEEVEIIEEEIIEEEKKIPEKLCTYTITDETISGMRKSLNAMINIDIIGTINELIDYLKSKGDE